MKLNQLKSLILVTAATLTLAGCQAATAKDASAVKSYGTIAKESFVVIAEVKVKAGSEAQFAQAARSILEPTRAEPDNILYDFYQSTTDATEFATYEQWSDQSGLDAHMQSAHMQAFFGVVGPLFETGYPVIKTLRRLNP